MLLISFQPLTELLDKKCKRCGFYEADTFKPDDIFDEWELCPDDFEAPNGKYIRLTQEEFNATFLCPECIKKVDPCEYLFNEIFSCSFSLAFSGSTFNSTS